MAQTIQARVGDTVRANFNLIYKNQEVAKLKDKESYYYFGFTMECSRQGAKSWGVASRPDGAIRCNQGRDFISEDMPVEVDFDFVGEDYRENDIWKLYLVYLRQDVHDFPMGDEPHPRKHLLGRVQLIK